jgi:hypothetical protein
MQSKFFFAVSFILLAGSASSAYANGGPKNNGSTSFTLDSTSFFGGVEDNDLDSLLVSASGNITGNLQNGNIPIGWSVLVNGSVSGYSTDVFQINQSAEGEGTFSVLDANIWQNYSNIAIGLKAGNAYSIFELEQFASAGEWFSSPAKNLSHFMIYGIAAEQTPTVPLPSAFWFLGSGLLGLLVMGRNKPTANV